MPNKRIQDFWNSRARLDKISGTDDFPLKKLELDLILKKIPSGASVLDIGCGNGETLIRLCREKGCTGVGVDFSQEMINLAVAAGKKAGCADKLKFQAGAIPGLSKDLGEFDCVLTERSLINLDSEATQKKAFQEIISHLKPRSCYLMIESFIQGLQRTNQLREMLGLEKIAVPWHNVFLDETAVASWAGPECLLREVIPFSSTYHFLSRVVYARLAADKGEKLRYDSDINMLSLKLPVIGDFGPVRLWLWQRVSSVRKNALKRKKRA